MAHDSGQPAPDLPAAALSLGDLQSQKPVRVGNKGGVVDIRFHIAPT
jgi:hypothetical protein